jgi:hypothetical protein
MKLLAIIIMLAALYLLYRIACPKQPDTAKGGGDIPRKEEKPARSVIGKSRFVLPARSQPLQTTATEMDIEKSEEKPAIFAAETEEKRSAEIPAEELDEAFGKDGNPGIMSIPLDYPDIEIDDDEDGDINFEAEEAEEAEEPGKVAGHEAIYADGYDFDDLQTVAQAVREQPETVSEQTGKTLVALEHTELLALLAGDDNSKVNWIKMVIDRHVQSTTPETETEVSTNTDYGDFEIADFLSYNN